MALVPCKTINSQGGVQFPTGGEVVISHQARERLLVMAGSADPVQLRGRRLKSGWKREEKPDVVSYFPDLLVGYSNLAIALYCIEHYAT